MSNPLVVFAAVSTVILLTLWLGVFTLAAIANYFPEDLNDDNEY